MTRHPHFAALTLLLASATSQAQLIDLDVTVNGAALPQYLWNGEHFIEGANQQRYALEVRNRTPGRLLVVLAVDGINIISGQTAATSQSGYVLDGYQSVSLSGWRKSQQEVAAFYFTQVRDSYAGKTGRGHQVGVIGAAVFQELLPEPQPAPEPEFAVPPAMSNQDAGRDRALGGVASTSAPNESKAQSREEVARRAAPNSAPAPAAPLGTGHGERRYERVDYTQFVRATQHPAQVLQIRYLSRAGLEQLGVLNPPPRAFPNGFGFVPDPPR
jgi:hypothetical protein